MLSILLLLSNFLNFLPDHPNLKGDEKPDWVTEIEYTVQDKHSSQKGAQYLLFDKQVNLDTKEVYIHIARKVLEGGLDECSKIEIDFAPSYQYLSINDISIYRDGIRVDNSLSNEAHLLQREEDLSNNIYRGRLELFILLHGLQKNDIVEFSYTFSGQNPSLKDHFFDSFELSYPFQVDHLHYRCLRDKEKPFFLKMHNTDLAPKETYLSDSLIETSLTVSPSVIFHECDTPSWNVPDPWLQISSFGSWSEVSDWGKELFLTKNDLDAELQSLITSWSAEATTKEDLILKALTFVQNEIHYFGKEEGIFALRPYSPHETLLKRFGDCKDKTLLLARLMDAIGVKSTPCLVNTDLAHAIENLHPTPCAFNHAILKIEFDGTEYLLDPTIEYQGGRLKERSQHSCYLPLGEGDLRSAPSSPESGIDILHHFDLPAHRLTVTKIVKGNEANLWRALLAYHGQEAISEYFSDLYDQTQQIEPFQITDDYDTNEITFVSNFEIDSETEYYPQSILESLPAKVDLSKNFPLAIPHPVKIHETIRVTGNYPKNSHEFERIDHPAFTFTYEKNNAERTYTYETKADHVLPNDLGDYKTKIAKIEELCTRSLGRPINPDLVFAFIGLTIFFLLVSVIAIKMFQKPKELNPDRKKKWKKAYWISVICNTSLLAVQIILTGEIIGLFVFFVIILLLAITSLLLFGCAYKRNGTILLGFFCFILTLSILNPFNLYLLIRSIQLFRYNRAMKRSFPPPPPPPEMLLQGG